MQIFYINFKSRPDKTSKYWVTHNNRTLFFSECPLSEATQKGLSEAGYKIPTEIQKESLGNVRLSLLIIAFVFFILIRSFWELMRYNSIRQKQHQGRISGYGKIELLNNWSNASFTCSVLPAEYLGIVVVKIIPAQICCQGCICRYWQSIFLYIILACLVWFRPGPTGSRYSGRCQDGIWQNPSFHHSHYR